MEKKQSNRDQEG